MTITQRKLLIHIPVSYTHLDVYKRQVYGRTQTAFSEDGLPIGAGLEDLGKGLRSQVGTTLSLIHI